MNQPLVSVGIVTARQIRFSLNGTFTAEPQPDAELSQQTVETVSATPTGFLWRGRTYHQLTLIPADREECSFSLLDVTIGKDFHWQRQEQQTFRGTLRLLPSDGLVCAVNELPVEEYLGSVISSEMSPTASLEFLKAHAVISRSWLLAQLKPNHTSPAASPTEYRDPSQGLYIKWYDHDDHSLFDVCADDHCQRYQGITKVSNQNAYEAVRQTLGQVLTFDGELCDTRFSKCCGGRLEEFQTCWADTPKPYLQSKPDLLADPRSASVTDAFCNTSDPQILSQVLNNFDQETTDFYRWTVRYTVAQLSSLIASKSGQDFGEILDLIPLQRGPSGRISLLKIVGSRLTLTVGKELEIRRWLSPTHLYSSAFDVEKTPSGDFILHGKGWGHGVGLCQIGAAVMGERDYTYDNILLYYYRGAEIRRIY